MEIGVRIRDLRRNKGVTQEEFADEMSVSVQTISRWENGVNCPDISILPIIATYFHVTADYLLGLERRSHMKLLKTVETFETETEKEAEETVKKFQKESFPKLTDYKISTFENKTILEVVKEFNADPDKMRF